MSYKVIFVGAQAHEEVPAVAVYAVERSGRVGKKIATVSDGALSLPEGRAQVIAFGPDVEDPAALAPKSLVTLRVADQLPVWERDGVLLPPNWWRGWLGYRICVSGNTYRCFPTLLTRDDLRRIALGARQVYYPEHCLPLCGATVEVWGSTTCCWPFLVSDVPNLISRLAAYLSANPVMFPPVPSPGPVERAVAARVDAALAQGKVSTAFVPSTALSVHLRTLRGLNEADAVAYVERYPALWPFWCDTNDVYLGETAVNPDGSFSFCYLHYPFFLLNCRTSYFYKVKQFVAGAWVYIYDGSAAGQYFAADDVADLYAQTGQLCYNPSQLPPGTATLEQIGFIPAYQLNSHWVPTPTSGPKAGLDQTQLGDGIMAALPQNAGLGLADGAPWADTLHIMLNFDPDLKGIDATYYRLSTVQADPTGSGLAYPGATPTAISNTVAWNYDDTTVTTTLQLGPVNTLANQNLFLIPYAGDHNWLGNADGYGFYHQTLDTTTLKNLIPGGPPDGNGQFLLILELFNSAGERLVPVGSETLPGDVPAAFSFVRQIAPATVTPPALNNAIVNQASLTHVIWVDNRSVAAQIVNFQSSDGVAVCQTLTGAQGDRFVVGYQAYHGVMCDGGGSPIPATTFISAYAMGWEKGLAGGTGALVAANEVATANDIPPPLLNAPTNCPAGANYVSTDAPDNPLAAGNTFGNLLGNDSFCAFSITLSVQPKHTDGFSTWSPVTDTAAVALSIG